MGAFEHSHAHRFRRGSRIIEEAEIDAGGVLGKEREIHAFVGHRGAEGIGAALPDLEGGHMCIFVCRCSRFAACKGSGFRGLQKSRRK